MKYILPLLIAMVFANFSYAGDRYWISASASNWNNTANWSTASGGAGGASVPGVTDNVFFDGNGLGNCNVDVTVAVASVTVGYNNYNGTVDLNGYDFTTTGTTLWQFLTIDNSGGTGKLIGTGGNITIGNSTVNSKVDIDASLIYFSNNTFNDSIWFTKQGANCYSGGGNTYNSFCDFVNDGYGVWYLGNGGSETFNENISFGNTQGNYTVQVGSGGAWTLAAGKTITTSASGFANGELSLYNFNPAGTGDFDLTFGTISAKVAIKGGSTFNGKTTITAPEISVGSSTFNDEAHFVKTGGNSLSEGGATFNDDAHFTNSGTGYFVIGGNTSHQFNGDLYVNSTSTADLRTTYGSGTINMGAGKTIKVGTTGFDSGSLVLRYVTQDDTTPFNFSLGTGAKAYFEEGCVFDGTVTLSAGRFYFNGGTFNNASHFTKTSNSSCASSGGATFNDDVHFIMGGTNSFWLGGSNSNTYNSDVYLGSTANGYLYTGSSAGSFTIASGNQIKVDTAGFNDGSIIFNGVDQQGATTQTLDFSGGHLTFEDNCEWDGELVVNGRSIALSGGVFNNVCTFNQKTDGGYGGGGCTFNNDVAINNEGSGYFWLNGGGNDVFNGNITITSTGANVTFGNTSTGATLASGKTISIGAGGFVGGTLQFRNFNQLGTTIQTITLTANGRLDLDAGNIWNGDCDFTAKTIYLDGSTYNGDCTFTRSGFSNTTSTGGNTFNGTATFTHNSTGYWRFANASADDYNDDVSFISTSSGDVRPNYNTSCNYAGDISFNTPNDQLILGEGGSGKAVFDGTSAQAIIDLGSSQTVTFSRMKLDKSGSDLTLNMPVAVSTLLELTDGNINTTAANVITLNDDVSISGVSNNSYVAGPCKKIGDDAFSFPVGDAGIYLPISISAPSNATDAFTAEYIKSTSAVYSHASKDPTIDHLSVIEYWILDRTTGTSNVSVNLAWGAHSGVDNLSELAVCRWDGSQWKDHGNDGFPNGNTTAGDVTSMGTITSFSPFTLGSSTGNNPLPVSWLSFTAELMESNEVVLEWETGSELNNDHFIIEKSNGEGGFNEIGMVYGAGNSNVINEYSFIDTDVEKHNYYRLKQVDYNGQFDYSSIQYVGMSSDIEISIYPNPVIGNSFEIKNLSTDCVKSISVYNSLGDQIPFSVVGNKVSLFSETRGVSYVQVSFLDGTIKTQKVVLN